VKVQKQKTLKPIYRRHHSAAEPQPKGITPSLPSPLEGEG